MEQMKKAARRLLRPHGAVTACAAVLSAALLIYVFINGLEESVLAYIVYPLSAWALTATVLWTVEAFPAWKQRALNSTAGNLLQNAELRRAFSLYSGLGISLFYALFKLAGGWVYRSTWLMAVAIYYMVLAVMRYLLLKQEKRGNADERKIFSVIGALMLLLGVTMTGMAVQMVRDGQGYSYPGFMIYASAAYTFYSVITALVQLIRRRRERGAAQKAARMLSCAVALMALYGLQTALIDQFGAAEGVLFRRIMNALTGVPVCGGTMAFGVYMIWCGRKNETGRKNS